MRLTFICHCESRSGPWHPASHVPNALIHIRDQMNVKDHTAHFIKYFNFAINWMFRLWMHCMPIRSTGSMELWMKVIFYALVSRPLWAVHVPSFFHLIQNGFKHFQRVFSWFAYLYVFASRKYSLSVSLSYDQNFANLPFLIILERHNLTGTFHL